MVSFQLNENEGYNEDKGTGDGQTAIGTLKNTLSCCPLPSACPAAACRRD